MINFDIDYKEVLQKYPKSSEKLSSWISDKMGTLAKSLGSEVQVPRLSEEQLAQVILTNPRNLLDFFDDQDIRIGTNWTSTSYKYEYYIDGEYKGDKESRSLSEIEAYKIAFDMLEDNLNE